MSFDGMTCGIAKLYKHICHITHPQFVTAYTVMVTKMIMFGGHFNNTVVMVILFDYFIKYDNIIGINVHYLWNSHQINMLCPVAPNG